MPLITRSIGLQHDLREDSASASEPKAEACKPWVGSGLPPLQTDTQGHFAVRSFYFISPVKQGPSSSEALTLGLSSGSQSPTPSHLAPLAAVLLQEVVELDAGRPLAGALA